MSEIEQLQQRVKILEDHAVRSSELMERLAKTCADFVGMFQSLLDKLGAPRK